MRKECITLTLLAVLKDGPRKQVPLELRMESHEYGLAMAKVVKAVYPLAYDSFKRHMEKGRAFLPMKLTLLR